VNFVEGGSRHMRARDSYVRVQIATPAMPAQAPALPDPVRRRSFLSPGMVAMLVLVMLLIQPMAGKANACIPVELPCAWGMGCAGSI